MNAANAELLMGGGVAGALHQAAGPELADAGAPFSPISPGEAVITNAFNLPNDYVIHCLGPVYGLDRPEEKLLRDCYVNALRRAEEKEVKSIAFPSISTGAFGYPLEDAVQTALPAVLNSLDKLQSVRHIRFVLFSKQDFKAYEKFLTSEDQG
ncbi:macro domain-containing protein [Halobacillus sp. A5]|uniref:macro domain-containing protein n=1 Tax=Halobacillus sp. A5 TaxID=2880263 RepID=UPI0020A6AD1C|nr:macro domain-containing protein [Halobacillus sp. A5]